MSHDTLIFSIVASQTAVGRGAHPVAAGSRRLIGAATAVLACSAALAAISPYPPSPVIQGITWDLGTHFVAAPGSDLWPVTWGSDDNLHTSWGDGGGFGGTNDIGRVSLGFGTIVGGPEELTEACGAGSRNLHNVWGGACTQHPVQFGGKVAGMLSVDGTLYAWVNQQNQAAPDFRLAWSTDLGATWQLSSWFIDAYDIAPAHFVNYGRDYAGARDDYVYMYGGDYFVDPEIYLFRVHKTQIKDLTAYQYFSGIVGGQPTWSWSPSDLFPVFTDPNIVDGHVGGRGGVTYHPVSRRYLLPVFHDGPGGLGIFDAPEPWGPWTTVMYVDNWLGMGSSGWGLGLNFPQKWQSADGRTLWSVFSVNSGSGTYHDRFNLMKVTLTFTAPPPGEVTGLRFALSETLTWDDDGIAVAYDLYRDDTAGGYGDCEQQDLPGATATDRSVPPVGQRFFYLVTAKNELGEEETKGFGSGGTVRSAGTNLPECP